MNAILKITVDTANDNDVTGTTLVGINLEDAEVQGYVDNLVKQTTVGDNQKIVFSAIKQNAIVE